MKKMILPERLVSLLLGCCSIGAFILIWYLGTAEGTTLGVIIPGPDAVFIATLNGIFGTVGKHSIIVHMGISLLRVFVGFTIGSVLGVVVGLLIGWYRMAEAVIQPIFRLLRPIPPIAWIPISILWFGLGESGKVFLIILATFNNVTLNAWRGAKSVDRELIGAAKMLGANKRQIFFTIVVPSAMPEIFAGLQIGMTASWATILAAEMVRSSEGLGWMIVAGMTNIDMEQILAGIVSIGCVGFALAVLMRKAEGRLCRWNKSGQ